VSLKKYEKVRRQIAEDRRQGCGKVTLLRHVCFVKKKFKKIVDNPGNLYYYITIDRTVGHFLPLAAEGQSLMKEE
jgi:hypothetical protein